MNRCNIAKADLGYCFEDTSMQHGNLATCALARSSGSFEFGPLRSTSRVGCVRPEGANESNRDYCTSLCGRLAWDGTVCFTQQLQGTLSMYASELNTVDSYLSDLRREAQQCNPRVTRSMAAGCASNTFQILRNRLQAASAGSLPELVSGGTLVTSIGLVDDVLKMARGGVLGTDADSLSGQPRIKNAFTKDAEIISQMAYVAGAEAIRSQNQSELAAATGADLYIGRENNTESENVGIELAVIVERNVPSNRGWSRQITMGNIVVTASESSFLSVASESGADFFLSVTRYDSSDVTNEMFPPSANNTNNLLPSVVSVIVPSASGNPHIALDEPISIRFNGVDPPPHVRYH